MLLNDKIAGIEKSDGICFLTFVEDYISGLLLYPLIFSLTYSRPA